MAQQTYAREKSSHAKLTAIDVRGPSTPTASVKVERGLFFQMDISSIGKADLITDVEGVLGYSILFSEDLSKALSHLKPGGTLMFSMQRQTQDGHPLAFTNKDGAPITAETYFSKIKGLSSFEVDDAGTFVRVILVRGSGPIEVSPVVISSYHSTAPPERNFQETTPEGQLSRK